MKKHSKSILFVILLGGIVFWMQSCKPEPPDEPADTNPTPYKLTLPANWPQPKLNAKNPLTVEGIALGRKLFYDPILSRNQTQSCAGCHNQAFAFTDNGKQFSIGSEGDIGTKNAMPIYNMNWNSKFFWDGRAATLEDQVRMPVEAHNEMNYTLGEAVTRLKAHPEYPAMFTGAFPNSGITELNIQYAIAQFMRSIISKETKFDEYFLKNPRNPENLMNPGQKRGYLAFISESKGDCFHCHSPLNPFFVNLNEREFSNNGLDAQPDDGHYAVTGNSNDKGKFKTATLKNITLTAPYMHDGRFATLMDVLNHYDTGFHYSPTLDPMLIKHIDQNTLQPVKRLSQQDKEDIIEFLKLLTDSALLSNPAYSKP